MAVVLIVDDNASTRWVLTDVVTRERHQVLEAEDGKEAVEIYRARRPDLVVIDLFMPEHDGFEAIRTLRTEFPDSRIIAVSGDWMVGDKHGLRFARELGADVTIRKPFNVSVLRAAVNELLAA
jgi:CheY-like chemotaxis protein